MKSFRRIPGLLILTAVLVFSSCELLSPLGEIIHDRLQLAPPSMDAPAADANGYSNTDIVITLIPSIIDDTLLYTIDRSDPGENGIQYTGPFTISGHNDPILVKALARKDGRLDSEIIQAEYLILYDSAEIPIFSPAAGSFTDPLSITMSSGSAGAAVWYTLDGTNPRNSASRILYSGSAITVSDDGTPDGSQVVVNAVTQVAGLPDSPIATGAYDVQYSTLSMPDLSPPSQQSQDPFSVTMTSPDGAAIWYTTDGSSPLSGDGALKVPSPGAVLYSSPVAINWSGYDYRVIKAACFASGYRPSVARIGSYFKQTGQTPAPNIEIFNPASPTAIPPVAGVVYTNAPAPAARIASPPAGTRYFYTTDGTMPMISINGAVIDILTPSTNELSGSANLNNIHGGPYNFDMIAVSPGSDPSALVSAPYIVDYVAPPVPVLGSTGLTNASDSNVYLNAARWADQAWSVTLTGDNGFEWRWSGDVTATATMAASLNHGNLSGRLSTGDGSYILQVRTQDLAGNWSLWQDFPFIRDTAAPGLDFSTFPIDGIFGQTLATSGQYNVRFLEAMEPGSLTLQILEGGSPVPGSVVTPSAGNQRFDLDVPAGLDLDKEFTFQLTAASDMAGNPWAGPALTSDFVTGAIFWSGQGRIYRAPITSRPGYSIQSWYTAPAGTTVTEIEVADGKVFWVETDPGGDGTVHYADSKQSSAGAVTNVALVITNPVRDIEVDSVGKDVYFTAPGDIWTIRSVRYVGLGGNGEETSGSAPNPHGLAWDGSDYYWAGSVSAFFYTGAGPFYDPGGILGGTTNLAVEYKTVGAERRFYVLNAYYIPNPSFTGSTGISMKKFSLDMSTPIAGGPSVSIPGTLYADGSTYGGDLEIVEIGGVNRIFALAPTITGPPLPGGPDEYCAVYSMDLNLGGLTELYNPRSLGLVRSLDGGLAIDTE